MATKTAPSPKGRSATTAAKGTPTTKRTSTSTKKAPARPAARATGRTKARALSEDAFAELMESVREGARILRGEQAPARTTTIDTSDPDVVSIRERLGLSRVAFAALLGVPARTLEGWEQGRRAPRGAERALLRVAERQPDALVAALR